MNRHWIAEKLDTDKEQKGASAFMDIVDELKKKGVSLEDFKLARGGNHGIRQLMALAEPTDEEIEEAMKNNKPSDAQKLSHQNMFMDMTENEYEIFKNQPYKSKYANFFIKKLSEEFGRRQDIERDFQDRVTTRNMNVMKKNKQRKVYYSSNKMRPGPPLVDSDSESDSEEDSVVGGDVVEGDVMEAAVVGDDVVEGDVVEGDDVVEEVVVGGYRKRRRKKKIRKKKKTKKRKRKNTKKKKKKRRRRTKKKRRRRR